MLSLGLSSLDLSRTASLRYLASEGCDCCFELGLSLAGLLPSRCGGGWEQGLGASRWGPSCPWRWRCLGGQAAWGPHGAAATGSSSSTRGYRCSWVGLEASWHWLELSARPRADVSAGAASSLEFPAAFSSSPLGVGACGVVNTIACSHLFLLPSRCKNHSCSLCFGGAGV